MSRPPPYAVWYRDVRLMMIAGFNAEAVSRARARDRPVVDPETRANHLARISPRSAARTFAEHVVGFVLVTRARDEDLEFVRGLDRLAASPEAPWQWAHETHSRLGQIRVHLAGFDGIELYDKDAKAVGRLNAAVADEYDAAGQRLRDEKGDERPRFHYATPLPSAAQPHRIRRYYGQRGVIENQGFRELTPPWALDCPAGRRFNALNSRIAFTLMLYNGDRLLRMKHPELCQEVLRRQRAFGERNRLACISHQTPSAKEPDPHSVSS